MMKAALLGSLVWTTMASGFVCAQDMEGFDPNAAPVPDFKLTAFYEANLDYVGKKPGEVIKAETIRAPEGSVAWRVMYVSRNWDDRLVPVTGIVVAPKEPGAKPRRILSWAHGTTGGARTCAPSLAENPAQNQVQRSPATPIDYGIPYLTDFLERGFVVVATDYYGLGGPGVHQYVVGSTAARDSLDIVRAARVMEGTNAGPEFVSFGWSQGGHAALFTGEEQPGYAPELKHLGVVVIAPGTTDFPKWVNIPHAYILARGYSAAYHIPLDEFTRTGKQLIDVAGDECISGVFRASLRLEAPFFTDMSPAMKKAMQANLPGQRKSPAPILVVHGEVDNVVAPEETRRLQLRAEGSGSAIKVSWYPKKGHRTVIDDARKEVLEWLANLPK